MSIKCFTFYFNVYRLYNLHRLFALLNGGTLKLSPEIVVLTPCARGLLTGPDYGQSFCLQRTAKGNFEKPQKFNEFSKLSIKSCMSRTMNNLRGC